MPEDVQKEYEDEHRQYIQMRKSKDPRCDDKWQSCISCIFEGATPTTDEQLNDLLTPRSTDNQSFPCADIWTTLKQIANFGTRQIVANRYTEKLADLAVDGYPEATSLSMLINKSAWTSRYITQMLVAFKKAFPAQMARLISRIHKTNLPICESLLKAYGKELPKDQVKTMLPEDLTALAALVTTMGSELGDEYHEMTKHVRKKNWSPPYCNSTHPITTLLQKLPEPYLTYTNENMDRIMSINNYSSAKALAESPNVAPRLLQKAIAHLAKLTYDDQMSLATPYELPKNVSGEKLCHILIFLHKSITNPSGMISGIPDPEDFAARTMELRFGNDEKTIETLKKATAARDSLVPKANGNKTAIDTLLGHLKDTVTEKGEIKLFSRFRRSHELSSEQMFILVQCLTDLQKCSRRMSADSFHNLQIGDIQWSEEPTEETAFKIVSAIESEE